VTKAVVNNPTPGNDRPATAQGTNNGAGITHLPSIAGPLSDRVMSYVTKDSNGNTVIANVSIPGEHIFNPAVVTQGISQDASGTHITLVGESNSLIHAGGNANPINLAAESIFQGQIEDDIGLASEMNSLPHPFYPQN
jgi:hypothetical protein